MPSRRSFLKIAGATGAAMLVDGATPFAQSSVPSPGRAAKPLNILILGGTGYIGPYQVRAAIARGHRITVFNRGVSQADLPKGVIFLQGDRSIEKLNLDALRGKTWDAAIDNSQIDPAWVTKTAELLKDSVKYYLYVSSTGVYLPYLTPNIKEDIKPVLVDPDGGTSSYGVRKALSEIENTKVFGDRAINVRPNFIVGPGDPTPRFNYWPARHARGGEILVPGSHDDHVQFADVRDLTAFMIHLIETGRTGTFNIAGDDAMTMERFQTALVTAIPRKQTLTWIPDLDFLRANRLTAVVPWIPPKRNAKGEPYGQTYINSEKAVAAGLTYRPATETIRDVLAWYETLSDEAKKAMVFPITPEREATILKAWHAKGQLTT
jgi:2'-hydroxyisoflavone reductase